MSAIKMQVFAAAMKSAGHSPGTIEKYLRDTAGFAAWLGSGS